MADYDFSSFDKAKEASPKQYDFSAFDQHPNLEPITKLESLLRGGAQGLTFGMADELSGAAQSPVGAIKTALNGMLGNDVSSDSDVKEYTNARDQSRKEFEAAQAANPKTSFAGNILGSLAPSLLTGGVGAAAEAPSLGRALAVGAGIGGLNAVGNSNADLAKGQIGQLASQTALGAGIGAGTGALMHGAIQGVKGLMGTETAKTIGNAYEQGQAGTNLLTKEGREGVIASSQPLAEDLTQQFGQKGLRGKLGATVSDLISNAPMEEIDATEELTGIQKMIDGLSDTNPRQAPVKSSMQAALDKFTKDPTGETEEINYNLSPQELYSLKTDFQDLTPWAKATAGGKAGAMTQRATDTVGKMLEDNIPGLDIANTDFNVADSVSKLLGITGKKGEPSIVLKSMRNKLAAYKDATKFGANAKMDINSALENLNSIDPDLASSTLDRIQSTAQNIDTARKIGMESINWKNIPGMVTSGVNSGANIVGQAAGSAPISAITENVISPAINFTKALTKMPVDQLAKMGEWASTQGEVGGKIGNILTQAAQKDETGRNALLFTLMQTPAYRTVINNFLGKNNGTNSNSNQ